MECDPVRLVKPQEDDLLIPPPVLDRWGWFPTSDRIYFLNLGVFLERTDPGARPETPEERAGAMGYVRGKGIRKGFLIQSFVVI